MQHKRPFSLHTFLFIAENTIGRVKTNGYSLSLFKRMNQRLLFPKDCLPRIKIAEELTPEGDKMWAKLREEFVRTYFYQG